MKEAEKIDLYKWELKVQDPPFTLCIGSFHGAPERLICIESYGEDSEQMHYLNFKDAENLLEFLTQWLKENKPASGNPDGLWKSGHVPNPTGPAVLYRKRHPDSPFIALPALGDANGRYVWTNVPGCQTIEHVGRWEQWFIQEIQVPASSGTADEER